MRLHFLWIGKTKSAPAQSLVSDYLGRIRRLSPCDVLEVRDLSGRAPLHGAGRIEAEAKELARRVPAGSRVVALDEAGSQFTSRDFAAWLASEQNRGARGITFVIGGPEGLGRAISAGSDLVLSLGKMTWTHEICRVLLLEQVYRALCILRNIPYHKDGV